MNIFKKYFEKYPERFDEYIIMKEKYLNGESLTKICKEGILIKDRHQLSKLLKEDNIEIVQNNQKYKYNENAFKDINNEEQAYWLGFMYADGCINELKMQANLTLCGKDIEHVKRFRDFIFPNKDYPLVKKISYLSNNEKEYYSYRVMISNTVITQNLINKKCLWNKTFDLDFPSVEIVPDNLMNHFIRGFFDGDGSVFINKNRLGVSFVSASENFLNDLYDYIFEQITINRNKLYLTKDNNYSLQINSQKDIENFYNYIYNNSSIFLDRKKEIFDSYYAAHR